MREGGEGNNYSPVIKFWQLCIAWFRYDLLISVALLFLCCLDRNLTIYISNTPLNSPTPTSLHPFSLLALVVQSFSKVLLYLSSVWCSFGVHSIHSLYKCVFCESRFGGFVVLYNYHYMHAPMRTSNHFNTEETFNSDVHATCHNHTHWRHHRHRQTDRHTHTHRQTHRR